ncbi:Protein bfr2, partial [Termitomyces sp. J132]
LSLAQQLALLEDTAPIGDFDPEDVHARDVDGEDGMDVDPAAREHYLDVGPSLLRKQHDSVSDPKYDGVRTTRKQLEDDSEDDVGDESGSEGSELEEDDVRDEGEERSEQGDEDDEEAPTPQKKSKLEKRTAEKHEHGDSISSELALWDSLLDARIRLQKAVTAANRLPPPLDLKEHLETPECQEVLGELLREAAGLSEDLFQLQEHLLTTNDSISLPPRKRRRLESDDDTPIDYVRWLEDATHDASAFEQAYHPHLVQTLAKWSAKIQAVAPSALLPSNRGAFSSKNSQHTKTVLQLIDETLSDHTKLLARTQIRRSKDARIGIPEISNDEGPQEDPNVFDDTDFYQQMLRDVIDSKGNGTGGDDWMAMQKQKKARKKVDTKASKGRKLRYETHEKLQNFMVPVPVIGGWHEEQIDELFASLLGKGFEGPGTREDAADGEGGQEEMELSEALKDGFRVFG